MVNIVFLSIIICIFWVIISGITGTLDIIEKKYKNRKNLKYTLQFIAGGPILILVALSFFIVEKVLIKQEKIKKIREGDFILLTKSGKKLLAKKLPIRKEWKDAALFVEKISKEKGDLFTKYIININGRRLKTYIYHIAPSKSKKAGHHLTSIFK